MDVLTALLAAITGGTCLYLVCGAVLPEEVGEKQFLLRAAGGLLGFWLGVWLDFWHI